MISRISIFKYPIVGLFLTAYLSVFIVQETCGSDHLKDVASVKNKEESHPHSHSHTSGHDHHSHQTAEQSKHEHTDSHTHHNGKKEGDCCNDKTTDFFNSLTNPVIQSYDFKVSSLLIFDLPVEYCFISTSVSQTIEPYIDYWRPPPKAYDLRVFLNSFTI